MKNIGILYLFVLFSKNVFCQKSYFIAKDGNATSCFINDRPEPIYVSNKVDKKTYLKTYNNFIPKSLSIKDRTKRKYENKIVKILNNDSVLIITGAIYDSNEIHKNTVLTPLFCWTTVQSLSTKRIVICFIIEIDNQNKLKKITLIELEKKTGFKIPILNPIL